MLVAAQMLLVGVPMRFRSTHRLNKYYTHLVGLFNSFWWYNGALLTCNVTSCKVNVMCWPWSGGSSPTPQWPAYNRWCPTHSCCRCRTSHLPAFPAARPASQPQLWWTRACDGVRRHEAWSRMRCGCCKCSHWGSSVLHQNSTQPSGGGKSYLLRILKVETNIGSCLATGRLLVSISRLLAWRIRHNAAYRAPLCK